MNHSTTTIFLDKPNYGFYTIDGRLVVLFPSGMQMVFKGIPEYEIILPKEEPKP